VIVRCERKTPGAYQQHMYFNLLLSGSPASHVLTFQPKKGYLVGCSFRLDPTLRQFLHSQAVSALPSRKSPKYPFINFLVTSSLKAEKMLPGETLHVCINTRFCEEIILPPLVLNTSRQPSIPHC